MFFFWLQVYMMYKQVRFNRVRSDIHVECKMIILSEKIAFCHTSWLFGLLLRDHLLLAFHAFDEWKRLKLNMRRVSKAA